MDGTVLNLFENHFDTSNDRTVCKFVLVRFEEQVHIVFGPQSAYPYHASLIEHFCRVNEIASGWEHKPDYYEIFDSDAEILGGGYLDISPAARRIAAYGSSTAYGAFQAPEFRRILDSGRFFGEYEIIL